MADNPRLARAVTDAFFSGLEPLARDSLILRLAECLLAADPCLVNARSRPRLDTSALVRAREFLDFQRSVVRSTQLEAITGLTRYELARQFRVAYGTSPYRYSLQRRLDHARRALRRDQPLADVALEAGFADQAHFTRVFTANYGLPPGRYAALTVGSRPRAVKADL
ncbi:MAG TPA: helix-turn-helix transcriptional regulator [Chloroflexota bacterium]|jgi:AraC-like DNA-binding protein|nr:helix-turn-helix transcriptional regulator [Chloroflexota bacterium]